MNLTASGKEGHREPLRKVLVLIYLYLVNYLFVCVDLQPALRSWFSTLWVQGSTQDLRLGDKYLDSLSHLPASIVFLIKKRGLGWSSVVGVQECLASMWEVLGSVLSITALRR